MRPNSWTAPQKATFWTISFTLVAIGSWTIFYRPAPKSPIPYLKGSQQWPDSLLRKLDLDQQLGQLLVYMPSSSAFKGQHQQYVENWRISPGGFWLKDFGLREYLSQKDSLQRNSFLPLFWFSNNPVLQNNQFSDVVPAPAPGTLAAVPEKGHYDRINQLFVRQSQNLGLNLVAPFDIVAPWRDTLGQYRLLRNLSQAHIIAGAKGLAGFNVLLPDTLPPMVQMLRTLGRLHTRGMGLLVFEGRIAGADSLGKPAEGFLADYLFEKIAYQGLIAGIVSEDAPLEYWIRAGADLFITKNPPSSMVPRMKKALQEGKWRRSAMRRSLRKVFKAKQWMLGGQKSVPPRSNFRQLQTRILPEKNEKRENPASITKRLWNHFHESNWEQLSYRFREQALVLTHNSKGLVPWERLKEVTFFLWSPANRRYPDFEQMVEKYAPYKWINGTDEVGTVVENFPPSRCAVLALLDPEFANPFKDTMLLQALQKVNQSRSLVVINFGIPQLYRLLDTTFTIIHLFEQHPHTESLAAQVFFGGVSARGQWPAYDSVAPASSPTQAIRLGFAPPERSEIAPEKLVGIDAIARSAVDQGIIPGCQVLVAKDGRVIFSKAFGSPTFKRGEREVRLQNVYDIASLTKIAATTLAVMHLYEEQKIALNDPLGRHLTWLRGKAIGKISLRNLLTHQSGLPAGLPTGKYLRMRRYGGRRCGACFCNKKRGEYAIPMAENLFFSIRCRKELTDRIAILEPAKRPRYRYSDMNFWLLQQVVEAKTGRPFDKYLEEIFYRPLGLRHTRFNAAQHFSMENIVPSTQDKTWRRGLVQGYVHDPSAALLGGISGHAGLFSNVEDLAVIMQLLLDKGRYAGRQWFTPETVNLFTRETFGHHRGLGFEHPSAGNRFARARNAPASVFGHTGFTGACAWADPENRLIFIFLSNRTYPDDTNRTFLKRNIRGRIHQVAYDALGSYVPELPVLE